MRVMQNEKPRLEILLKPDTSVSGILRAIEAQTTIRIRAKATPPGSHYGR